MRFFATMVCVLGLAGAAAAPAAAGQAWGGTLGGGIVLPQDVAKDKFNRGWNLASGSTKQLSRSVAILTEVMYGRFGVADSVLRNLQVPEGNARILAGTVNFVLGPGASGPGFYLVGGGGIYNRKIEFSKPTTAGVVVFDPWLGTAVPIVVPAGETIASFSTTKPGVNGGLGVSLGKTSRVYLEARYHWIFTDNVKTTFIPINFGFRW
jgi:opacity protein-like surface antigen